MKSLLYFNMTTKAVTDASGSTWSPPVQTFGETMELAIRFQETINKSDAEVFPTVMYAKAGIGAVDARPTSGKTRIKVGDAPQSDANTTASIDFNAGAQELQNALNALSAIGTQFGAASVVMVESSYLIRFGAGAALVPLAVVQSELHPPCFGQVNSWQVAGAWISELRFIQAPAAFTDTSERVLPPAPTITRIQEGGSDGVFTWNEVQQMDTPAAFRGSYQFRRNNIRTKLLSRADGPTEVTEALAIYGDTISVTNPRGTIARIEFGGVDFAGVSQPLLEIIVPDAPEGDLTLALSLDKAPLAAMLRTRADVTLPLEVELGIADEQAPGGVRVEKFRANVTIQRGVIYAMLAAAAGIDWLRPVPVDYKPFTRDQILVGQLFWAGPIGDDEATEITVDHNLDTDAIAGVLVRENFTDGRVLTQGTDYTFRYGGRNSLIVTILGPAPATDGLALVITAAGMRAVFQAHTHTIQQIDGMEEVLEEIGQRLTRLETYLPSATPTDSTTGKTLTIDIPSRAEVLFYNPPKLDLAQLPVRPPLLLPAVHKVEALPLTTPLPAPSLNGLWTADARTLIPGSGYISDAYAETSGFVASDGNMLYPASRNGNTVSYYPTAFERTLWEFPINDAQLQVNRTLLTEFSVAAQLINATTEAQWVLLVEWGTPIDQSDPANGGQNLETIAWNAAPLLSQRIYVTPLLVTHPFGVRIRRTSSEITADQLRYGGWQTAGNAAPTAADFVLRARLANFDTKNNLPNTTGWLYFALGSADDVKAPAKATIA